MTSDTTVRGEVIASQCNEPRFMLLLPVVEVINSLLVADGVSGTPTAPISHKIVSLQTRLTWAAEATVCVADCSSEQDSGNKAIVSSDSKECLV